MKKLCIWGCCIERDLFGIPNDNEEFQIDRFVSFTSPLSFTEKPLEMLNSLDLSIVEVDSNFRRRNMEMDLKKTGENYFKETTAEWCLVDIADIRLDLLQTIIGNRNYFLGTKTSKFTTYNKNLLAQWLKKEYQGATLTEISPFSVNTDRLKKSIIGFAEILKKRFPTNRIIVNKVRMSEYYESKTGVLIQFSKSWNVDMVNRLLDECVNWLIEALEDCHVIEMPTNTIGKEAHKWGPSPLHYIDEYYRYGLSAIKIILNANGKKQEKFLLSENKRKAELKFLEYMTDVAKRTAQRYNIKTMLNEEKNIKKYYSTLKKIAMTTNFKKKIVEFFKEKGYKSVAFYRKTDITDLFCKLFEDESIYIAYIVENFRENIDNIKIIPKDSNIYPSADLIIICDLIWEKDIKIKLNKLVDFPIYTIDNILEILNNK